jgi:hypothetical protein
MRKVLVSEKGSFRMRIGLDSGVFIGSHGQNCILQGIICYETSLQFYMERAFHRG